MVNENLSRLSFNKIKKKIEIEWEKKNFFLKTEVAKVCYFLQQADGRMFPDLPRGHILNDRSR